MTMTDVNLDIGGMTCASCATRIERKLNRIDGVTASVNYATEKARVQADGIATADLIAAVEAAGYTAALPPVVTVTAPAVDDPVDAELAGLLQRLLISAVLAVPVVVSAVGSVFGIAKIAV